MIRHTQLLSRLFALSHGAHLEELQAYLDFVLSNNTPDAGHFHHILPRCLSPEFVSLADHPWNGQSMRLQDHIEAHRLLALAFPDRLGVVYAYSRMRGRKSWGRLSKGCVRIHMYGVNKIVYPSEVQGYLDQGWQLGGRRGHRWVFKTRPHTLLIGRGNTHKKPLAALNSPLGYRWFNDGTSEWMLPPESPRASGLALGRCKAPALGKVWVNDGAEDLLVYPEEIPSGFHRGRLKTPSTAGRVWVHLGNENRSVLADEVEVFIANDYQLGMAPVDRSYTRGTVLISNGLVELRVKDFSEDRYPGFHPGRLEENKKSATRHGYRWFTDGVVNTQALTAPAGFYPGKCEHRPRKPYPKGRKWYTDGTKSIQVPAGAEAPEGFRPGRA